MQCIHLHNKLSPAARLQMHPRGNIRALYSLCAHCALMAQLYDGHAQELTSQVECDDSRQRNVNSENPRQIGIGSYKPSGNKVVLPHSP